MAQSVDAYRAGLTSEALAAVDALRAIAREAGPTLDERIKWNAPSFAAGDDDRITLNLAPKGGVRVVLHRGAKVKDGGGLVFDDPDGLATWPAADRGVLSFAGVAEIEGRRAAILDLFRRWLAATA